MREMRLGVAGNAWAGRLSAVSCQSSLANGRWKFVSEHLQDDLLLLQGFQQKHYALHGVVREGRHLFFILSTDAGELTNCIAGLAIVAQTIFTACFLCAKH